MRLNYPDKINIDGNIATHINDGIYKVDNPYTIKVDDWANNKENYNCAIIGTDYSADYTTCKVVYFTNKSAGELLNFLNKLNENSQTKYGYTSCIYHDYPELILGGYIFDL